MNDLKLQIRQLMLYKFQQSNSASATAKIICKIYGEGTISNRAVQKWFIKFRCGDVSLRDDERSGRPSDFDEDALKKLVEQNPRYSTRQMANALNIPQATICRHLKKLGMVREEGVWVPHEICRGKPKTNVNGEQLKTMVEVNPYTTIRTLTYDTGVGVMAVHLATIGKVKKWRNAQRKN